LISPFFGLGRSPRYRINTYGFPTTGTTPVRCRVKPPGPCGLPDPCGRGGSIRLGGCFQPACLSCVPSVSPASVRKSSGLIGIDRLYRTVYPPGGVLRLLEGPRTPADLAAGNATVQAGRLFIVGILRRTPRLKPPVKTTGLPYHIAKEDDGLERLAVQDNPSITVALL
jgi:hypothetical protein